MRLISCSNLLNGDKKVNRNANAAERIISGEDLETVMGEYNKRNKADKC